MPSSQSSQNRSSRRISPSLTPPTSMILLTLTLLLLNSLQLTSSFQPHSFITNHHSLPTHLHATTPKSPAQFQPQPQQPQQPQPTLSPCTIKVIGVGGGGSNAVDRMLLSPSGSLSNAIEFWCCNTDAQALNRSKSKGARTLNLGQGVSRGLGAGGRPDVGRKAAEESREMIGRMVEGTDLCFITAGLGGGTGSGAAPLIAEIAKSSGALTIGVVTKPFNFEGRKRMLQAELAIAELKNAVDTVIVVANDKLLEIIPANTPLEKAFAVADDILRQGVVGISEIIVRPGLINVDFADVRAIMSNAGTCLMGIGTGEGKTRALDAARAAISSPLLDSPISRASGVVFNIIGGPDLTLAEINIAAEEIYRNVDEDANIIFGALVDEGVDDGSVSITVLATGFKKEGGSGESGGVGKDRQMGGLGKPRVVPGGGIGGGNAKARGVVGGAPDSLRACEGGSGGGGRKWWNPFSYTSKSYDGNGDDSSGGNNNDNGNLEGEKRIIGGGRRMNSPGSSSNSNGDTGRGGSDFMKSLRR